MDVRAVLVEEIIGLFTHSIDYDSHRILYVSLTP
jgi:hypothetical protein